MTTSTCWSPIRRMGRSKRTNWHHSNPAMSNYHDEQRAAVGFHTSTNITSTCNGVFGEPHSFTSGRSEHGLLVGLDRFCISARMFRLRRERRWDTTSVGLWWVYETNRNGTLVRTVAATLGFDDLNSSLKLSLHANLA